MDKVEIKINDFERIDEILSTAEAVFKPNLEEKEKYHNKIDWLNRAKDGVLISAVDEDKIVGFAICYKKTQDSLHIWNVGVLEEYRKLGVWRNMYESICKFAVSRGFKYLTLNTYKESFPGMYNFMIKEGFEEYHTEVDTLSNLIKSSFRKMVIDLA